MMAKSSTPKKPKVKKMTFREKVMKEKQRIREERPKPGMYGNLNYNI